MIDAYVFRIFNLMIGVIGLIVAIGILLAPSVVTRIDKFLDKNFSTEKWEQILNQRRNLTDALMKRPKIFGSILLVISFLLLLSSIVIF